MGNPGKAWEILGKHGKSRQGIGNPEKAWKILGKHGRYQEFRESTGNPRPGSSVKTQKIPGFFSRWDLQWAYFSKSLKNNKKAWKITGKHGKYRESIELPGKSRAGTASLYIDQACFLHIFRKLSLKKLRKTQNSGQFFLKTQPNFFKNSDFRQQSGI